MQRLSKILIVTVSYRHVLVLPSIQANQRNNL